MEVKEQDKPSILAYDWSISNLRPVCKNRTSLAFLWVLIGFVLVGQDRSIAIRIDGVEKTKPDYLQQFIDLKPGDTLGSVRLEANRQPLVNLEILSNAKYEVTPTQGGVEVTFHCFEVRTLLPLFNFGGVQENFWFLIGATEVNLAGRGNKLLGYYQYYDRSSIILSLTLDRIRQSNWGTQFNYVKWSTVEPLFFDGGTATYDYDNFTYGVSGLYHFNFRSSLEFNTAYFSEEYNRVDQNTIEGAPQRAKIHKQLFKLIYRSRDLDYHYWYVSGISNTTNAEAVLSYDGDPGFYIVFHDFQAYWRQGKQGNFANRLRLGLATNRDSPFAPFVLDSYVNIRGVGNRVDRGTAMIIMNNEYRHTLTNWNKIATQAVAFSDWGTWRLPGGELSDLSDATHFEWFAGAGVRVIHKEIFNAVLRIDYGINVLKKNSAGFVIGVGQYF